MIKYFNKWRALCEVQGPSDYSFMVERSTDTIKITIIDKKTSAPVSGKPNQYGEPTGEAGMLLQKRDDNDFWEVSSIAAPEHSSGVGKELYLLALELASDSGLSPDSVSISPRAKTIWNDYLRKHPSVTVDEKESEVDADVDDPYKYVFYIAPGFESGLDVVYKRTADRSYETPSDEDVPPPFDPEVDIEDYLEDIYENTNKKDTNRVSKVVIYQKNGTILLLKRVDGEKNWDLPGGHLKQDEDHLTAASRETKEETNLDIGALKHVKDHQHLKFYKCAAPAGDIQLQPEEHDDFKWVNPRDINNYPIRKSIKDAILDAIGLVQEDFQQNVKKGYSKLKFKLIGQGKNTYNVGGKMEKPSYKRSKSAPPGFGGSLEEKCPKKPKNP